MRDDAFFILGATSAIAGALARRLAGRGARLFLAARNAEKLAPLAGELGADSAVVDAARFEDVMRAAERAAAELGPLRGAVNCAGSFLLKPAHSTTKEDFLATVHANLTSAFALTRACGALMREGGGSVVLVSSAAARTGMANHEAIAAAKGGVIGLTLSAAATYARFNIRFNCVAPGLTRTPLVERVTANAASLKASTAMHALGRIGDVDDVARAMEFLLDPANAWITGQVLGVDGGLGSVRPKPEA